MNILHPIKNLKILVINKLITEALEEIPRLKQIGLLYLEAHKDEFFEYIFEKIKVAVKDFITNKINQAKNKIIETTESKN